MSWCREVSAALIALAAVPACGAEWTLGVSGGTRLEAIGNPRLAVPEEGAATRLTLSGAAALRGRTEIAELSLDAELARHASDESSLDTTDGSLRLGGSRRFERGSASASLSYRRDSTQASELEETGVLVTRAQRDDYAAGLSLQRALSERLSATAGVSASALRYDRASASLFDSDTQGATLGASYVPDARTTLGLAGSVSHVGTDPFSYRARTASLQASASYAWSERLSFSVAYGPSRTRIESAALVPVCPVPVELCLAGVVPFEALSSAQERVSTGAVYSASASWRAGLRTELGFAASRSRSPSGAGFLSQTDSASARLSHRLAEHLTAGAEVLVSEATSTGTAATRTRSQRYGVSLAWRFAEAWSLDAGARVSRSELPGGLAPASAAAYAGLRWQPRERRL